MQRDFVRPFGNDPADGLFGMTRKSLRALLVAWNEPRYRAEQILQWAYRDGAESFEAMTNLSKALRARLAEEMPLYQSQVVSTQRSGDGTVKRLLAWSDGATSECVLIPDGDRRTACISSQIGCPVGCTFCASGLGGLERQLAAAEIVEQAMRIRQLCGNGERLSHVVFMGLGEPLANYAATIHAARTINADWGMGIGARKITISTVGLPTQIRRLADEDMQFNLAISLHAPNDELRRRLIPWAQRVTIAQLTDAANYFFDKTGREVTLEYILLSGVNDSLEQARSLAVVARRMRSNVNLIPYNPVESLPFERPDDRQIKLVHQTLRDKGVNVHVRRSRGLDIDGACGQLRRRHQDQTVALTVS